MEQLSTISSMVPLARRLGRIWKTRTVGPQGNYLGHVWRLHRASAQRTEATTIVPLTKAQTTQVRT